MDGDAIPLHRAALVENVALCTGSAADGPCSRSWWMAWSVSIFHHASSIVWVCHRYAAVGRGCHHSVVGASHECRGLDKGRNEGFMLESIEKGRKRGATSYSNNASGS